MIRALVVDDEPYAREELAGLLARRPDVQVIDACANAIEALAGINRLRPDVVFLDIQMPRITGLELVGMLDPGTMPHIVFVTAYDEYAVRAFESSALDYLLKPVAAERIDKTIARLKQRHAPAPPPGELIPPLKQIPCFIANRIKLIPVAEVEYAYSDMSGVHVATAGDSSYTDMTLAALEAKTDLVRCHRQWLVRLDLAREIHLLDTGGAEIAMRSGTTVPVSRRYLRALKERLGVQ
ncbi:MAG: two-component system response regulator BtsR [Rhodospirillaceae bacterium]|nr:two-component system response regulator BtsR [Rhodospirillaceae bacterium]